MKLQRLELYFAVGLVNVLCAGCGGGGGDQPPAPPPAATHSVGGSVSGLSGSGLTLRINGGNDLAVAANGSFAFNTQLASGAAYSVTVFAQPSIPSQTCTPSNASGSVGGANILNVTVACTTNVYSVGGTVSGLSAAGLALTLNGSTALGVEASGNFIFPVGVASGGDYAVTIATQPETPPYHCVVADGSGKVGGQNVTSVQVACINLAGTVGGTVAGLSGTGLELRNNGGDALIVDANGSFRFDTAVPAGDNYIVSVATQPRLPRQNCVVSHAAGTSSDSVVTSVQVDCVLRPGNLRASIPAPNYPQGSGELQTFTSLNAARGGGGFGQLAQDVSLDAAAHAHALYLATHSYSAKRFDPGLIDAHGEQSASSLFTGAMPADRARAAGYGWIDGAEASVFNVGTASRDCSDQVLDSLVLRNKIMNTGLRDMGVGIADTADGNGFVCVVLAAYADFRGEAPAGWVGMYPFDSADEVSIAMASDSTGDTFGANRGMPLMLMADRDAPLSLTVTMRKSATDAVIKTTTITNGSLPAELTSNQVFAIPSIYLEPGTQYTVRAVGTVEGIPVDQTTHFTTGQRSHSARFVAGQTTGTLRAVYVYPADHAVSVEYQDAVQVAVEHLQGWYQQQLGGETFSIYRTQPEICALPRDSAYYYDGTWSKIQTDIQSCVPVRFGDPDYDWIIFADVDHGCTLSGNLDAGGDTLGMLQRRALEGLVGRDTGVDECARTHTVSPMARWIGLLAHEVGHTLGLPHPCDTYQAGCDIGSVMWQSWETYPVAYFAPADRATLLSHRFINVQRFGH